MTVKGDLIMALDHIPDPKNPAPSETYSFREGDAWFVTSRGPRHTNLYQVDLDSTDQAGMAWLAAREREEKTSDESKDGGPHRPAGDGPGPAPGVEVGGGQP